MILKEIRESIGITQREMSNILGIPRINLYTIEKGINTTNSEVLDRLLNELAYRVDINYIAGLIDRSSSIGITYNKPFWTETSHNGSYIARFVAGSIHKEIPEIIKRVLNCGKVTSNNSGRSTPYWQFYASNDDAGKALTILYPFLKIKREKAKILLEFRDKVLKNKEKRLSQGTRSESYSWSQEEINKEYDLYYKKIRSI